MTSDDSAVRGQVAQVERLLTGLDDLPDPARAQALDAVHALVTLYGACLARVMRHTDGDTARALAGDELVGHLLLVHDLHPDPPAIRIRRALARLGDLGGGERAGLDALDGATARVRVRAGGCGSGSGCGSSSEAWQAAVEAAVTAAAPEVERVELVTEAATARKPALIPVAALTRRPALEGHPR